MLLRQEKWWRFSEGADKGEMMTRSEKEREMREAESAFVEMNAVFEAVMCAIRGESLSDFALSHGAFTKQTC